MNVKVINSARPISWRTLLTSPAGAKSNAWSALDDKSSFERKITLIHDLASSVIATSWKPNTFFNFSVLSLSSWLRSARWLYNFDDNSWVEILNCRRGKSVFRAKLQQKFEWSPKMLKIKVFRELTLETTRKVCQQQFYQTPTLCRVGEALRSLWLSRKTLNLFKRDQNIFFPFKYWLVRSRLAGDDELSKQTHKQHIFRFSGIATWDPYINVYCRHVNWRGILWRPNSRKKRLVASNFRPLARKMMIVSSEIISRLQFRPARMTNQFLFSRTRHETRVEGKAHQTGVRFFFFVFASSPDIVITTMSRSRMFSHPHRQIPQNQERFLRVNKHDNHDAKVEWKMSVNI